MEKNLATIQQIDPSACVDRANRSPNFLQYYVSTDLKIPPRSSGESPAASTPAGAVAAYWHWIEALPEDKWITLPGIPDRRSDAYRWTPQGWQRRQPRP